MPAYDSKLVEAVAQNQDDGEVGDANKMEMLGALLQSLDVPYDEDVISDRDWVKPDDLRAAMYAIAIKNQNYADEEAHEYLENLRDEHAPTE